MVKQETDGGFIEAVPDEDGGKRTFFRQGKAGAWREVLSPELVQTMIEDHREVMMRFGYLTPGGRVRT